MTKIDLITGFLGSGKTTFLKRYAGWLLDQGLKTGIIENDSPYMDKQSKEYIEKKKNEKKWINKKNFNIFIGKASSVDISNSNEIKNYVGRTPSLPPVLYQFRKKKKNKWIGNGDFHLY